MDKIKKLLATKTISHSLVTLSATTVNGILGMLFFVTTARVLGPEQFGLLSVTITTLTLIADIADFGVNTGLINFISKNLNGNKKIVYQVMKMGLLVKLGVWSVVFIIGLPLSGFISTYLLLKPELTFPLQLAIVGVGGAMLFSFVTNCLQAFQKFWDWSILNIAMNLLRLILIFILIYLFLLNVHSVLLIYILVTFLGFALGLFLLPLNFLKINLDKKNLRTFLEYNRWVSLSIIVAALTSRVDTFFSTRYFPLFQVGIYAVATQISAIIPQFVYALAAVAAPKLGSFDKDEKAITYLKKLQLLCLGLAAVGIILLPLSFLLIPFFYGQQFINSIAIFSILFISQLFFLISIPSHQAIFYYFSQPKIFVFFSLLQLLVILISFRILIPIFSINGVALAVLIGSIFNFLVPLFYVLRQFKKSHL